MDFSQTNTSLEYIEISVHTSHCNNTKNTNNMLASSILESLVIPYQTNQSTDL